MDGVLNNGNIGNSNNCVDVSIYSVFYARIEQIICNHKFLYSPLRYDDGDGNISSSSLVELEVCNQRQGAITVEVRTVVVSWGEYKRRIYRMEHVIKFKQLSPFITQLNYTTAQEPESCYDDERR